MRILQLNRPQQIKQILKDIDVSSCGVRIMTPKAVNYLVKLDTVPYPAANILKQEMLSLGGDAALGRDALTGKKKKTKCLLIGNLSQLNRLSRKLSAQPFGLSRLSKELSDQLNSYQRDRFSVDLGKYALNLKKRAAIMGILNVTPDSFSGDGMYKRRSIDKNGKLKAQNEKIKNGHKNITDYAKQMSDDGADIIDIGGESSRPGAKPVSLKEELARVIPAVKLLAKKIKLPLSVDTCKPEVARQALDNGASIVNDITGLRDSGMIKVAVRYNAAVVIMHMKGIPGNMQKNPKYNSLIDDILHYLAKAIQRAEDAGIAKDKIIIDPGIGFGKTVKDNLEILKHLTEFKALNKPVLVGLSRKSFIGKVLGREIGQRLAGTLSGCVWAVASGAQIVRVHDVKEVKDALKIIENINLGQARLAH